QRIESAVQQSDQIAPAFLIMASAAVTAVTLTRFRETYRVLFAGGSSKRCPRTPLNVRRLGAFFPLPTMFPHDPKHAAPPVEGHGSLLVLALLALVVGAAAGLVGAIFRLTLEQADRLRDALIAWAQGEKIAGFLFVVATCAAAALIAAWLVRR